MTTQNTTNLIYTCNHTDCDYTNEHTTFIRFHNGYEHGWSNNGTRIGLMAALDEWYRTQGDERKHVCTLPGCDRQGSVMTAAGLAVHVIAKHIDNSYSVRAIEYAFKNGLEEVIRARQMRGMNQRQANTLPVEAAPF